MSDFASITIVGAGWLASMLVGAAIETWRVRRRRVAQPAAEGRRVAAAAFDSLDGLPQAPPN